MFPHNDTAVHIYKSVIDRSNYYIIMSNSTEPAGSQVDVLTQEVRQVSLPDETDAHRFRLVKHPQTFQTLGGQLPNLTLIQLTEREHHSLQILSSSHCKEVALILYRVHSFHQHRI